MYSLNMILWIIFGLKINLKHKNMKKLILLFAILIAFTSCKKDDIYKSDIEGLYHIRDVWDAESNMWIPIVNVSTPSYFIFEKPYSYKAFGDKYTYYGTFKIEGKTVICNVDDMIIKYYIVDMKNNRITFDLEFDNDGNKQRLRAEKQKPQQYNR